MIDLKPAMSVKARITDVKTLPVGEGVSYGLNYRSPGAVKICTMPIGYADGFRRGLSGRGEVGEGAHQIERPMERYLSREFHDLVPAHADAVHARVHLQMEGRGHPEGLRASIRTSSPAFPRWIGAGPGWRST